MMPSLGFRILHVSSSHAKFIISVTVIILWLTFSQAPVSAAPILLLGYDTTNPNPNINDPSPDLDAADVGPGIIAEQLRRGPGLVPNAGITLNSSSWSTAPNFNPLSDDFLAFGWSDSSVTYDLTDLTWQYDRNPNGPEQIVMTLSTNGGPELIVFSDSFVNPGDETATVDLSSFDAVDSARFRVYGFDAVTSSGTFDIEEIVDGEARGILIRGEVTAVPEPATMALLASIGTATWIRSRNRRWACRDSR